MSVGETRNIAISFSGKLDDGELLTGTPTLEDCAAPSPAVLTFSNVVVNTAAIIINGETVPIGEAVQGKVTATTAGKYTIKATSDTDSSPAQTLIGKAVLRVNTDC
jgi:hypothetical protein